MLLLVRNVHLRSAIAQLQHEKNAYEPMQPRFVLQRIAEGPAASVTAASPRVVTKNTSPGSVPQMKMVVRLKPAEKRAAKTEYVFVVPFSYPC